MLEVDGLKFIFHRTANEKGQSVDTVCDVWRADNIQNGKQIIYYGAAYWDDITGLIVSAKAILHPKDTFDKRIGKIVALSKCLDELCLSRVTKIRIFEEFDKVFPKRVKK